MDESSDDALVRFYRATAERGLQGFVPKLAAVGAMLEAGLGGEPLRDIVAAHERALHWQVSSLRIVPLGAALAPVGHAMRLPVCWASKE